MNTIFDESEAKRRFAELLDRAALGHERILIHRQGTPVAAIVSTDDLDQLSNESSAKSRNRKGLIAAANLLADIFDWDVIEREIGEARRAATDRPVDLD